MEPSPERTAGAGPPPWFDSSIDALVSPTLRRFSGSHEFERYRTRLHELAESHDAWWARALPPPSNELVAAIDAVGAAEPCDPSLQDCGVAREEITVTASRRVAPSITNNQEAGVDEGDIVKQFGRFLIVLHDGRLFSIDMGTAPGAMSFVDRIDVYSDPEHGTWYDELLITDDHLLVTGYDYELEASELAVFDIDADGVFSFAARYYLSSDDYYSSDNYATRLVDGNLVLYTPLYLTESDPDEPQEFPQIRRFTPENGMSDWQPLFTPADIYFPIQRTLEPTVHTVSVCPLTGRDFRCRSTGIIGPSEREFYVTQEYAYLWVSLGYYDASEWVERCEDGAIGKEFRPMPSALYRLPLAGGRARAVRTAGAPVDQFSLDARDDEFLALVRVAPGECETSEDYPLRYARIDADLFSSRPPELPYEAYWSVPTPLGTYGIENRFTEDYLVYGAAQGRWAAYGTQYEYAAADLVVVPVHDPAAVMTLPLAHSAERIEVFGKNVVVDGYRGNTGLSISTIELVRAPAVADVEYVDRVIESEGRSHAFNARLDDDGGGVFGLPTVFKAESWRDYSDSSNVHFFAVDAALDIRPSGYLAPDPDAVDDANECEVSCVDWYGNARPIFTEGRVFALMATELVEGRLVPGGIAEIQRVGMTGVPRHRR